MTCPYLQCGYYDIKLLNTSNLLEIPDETNKYFAKYQMLVVSAISVSGTLSYFSMLITLIGKSPYYWCRQKRTTNINYNSLSPFSTDTVIERWKLCTFVIMFAVNILAIAICIGILVYYGIIKFNTKDSDSIKLIVDCIYIVSQYVPWFCGIISCFIFSKISHVVSSTFTKDLYNHLKDAITEKKGIEIYKASNPQYHLDIVHRNTADNCPSCYFEILQDIDQGYVRQMKNSLKRFRWWLAIHWFFYTITTFLIIAYFIELVMQDVYRDTSHCDNNKSLCGLAIAYTLLISLGQCFLFIYPCLRAASVTAARYKVIRLLSQMHWKEICFDERNAFLQYMQLEDCTFKISILCANVTFGYNLAYFSIFAGIMAVVCHSNTCILLLFFYFIFMEDSIYTTDF